MSGECQGNVKSQSELDIGGPLISPKVKIQKIVDGVIFQAFCGHKSEGISLKFRCYIILSDKNATFDKMH